MKETSTQLHREFELDRMILFSDAVFAIAITLLILEIKFPYLPPNATVGETYMLFRPLIFHFYAFVISFFFIGAMWAKHLAIFKYLRGYNSTIITLNLIFLFFIVCFPFTVSGFSENLHSRIGLPILLYMGNIAFVTIARALLCIYLFRKNIKEVVPGFIQEKKYLLVEGIWISVTFIIIFFIMVIIYRLFPAKPENLSYGTYPLAISIIFMKIYLKKYKPAKNRRQPGMAIALNREE